MNRSDNPDVSLANEPWRNRRAPAALVSLALAFALSAVAVAALLPGPAALAAGVVLGVLVARR